MSEPLRLMPLEALPDGAARGYPPPAGDGYADLILVRRGDVVYGYRNICPHTGAAMEWQPDQFLDYTGAYIQCGLHMALFRPEDGYCVYGPCARQRLLPVPVAIEDGWIVALEGAVPSRLASLRPTP